MFFNVPNVIYWIVLTVVIAVQGAAVGRRPWPGYRSWPEAWRWLWGYDTLFGSSLAMIGLAGWNARTWGVLAVLTLASRLVEKDYSPLAGLWQRRESHRWTAQYFGAFLAGLIVVAAARLDLATWVFLFMSLGMCGAVKVGAEAYRESHVARQLREGERYRRNGGTG